MGLLINNRLLKTLLATVLATFTAATACLSQEVSPSAAVDAVVDKLIEIDDDNASAAEELKEMLTDLAHDKVDINAATREQLEVLPFLSPVQVENILFYVYTYGPMVSLDELRLVEGMDVATAAMLRPFVTVGQAADEGRTTLATMFKRGRSELVTRFRRTLDDKRGYADVDEAARLEAPGSYYAGRPFYNSVKYSYRYQDMMSIGVTAEKDPGEEFFRGSNAKGYDFYSAHFFARDIGVVKALAVGDYKATFGKGLVVSNDYYMGKNIYLTSLYNRRGGLRRHSSTDESNFLRGAGATFAVGRWELSAFLSSRRLDAVVENSLVKSLKTDGYHRLARDLAARDAVRNTMVGSNLTYRGGVFNIGLTVVGDFFNRPFTTGVEPYRLHYPEGRRFFNAGLAYDFRWRGIFVGGETAVDGRGNVATLNAVDIYPADGYRIFVLHRHYATGYVAHHARSMSATGAVRNERGVFCGFEVTAVPSLSLTLAVDCSAHPWLRYGIDCPSSGSEVLARAVYAPREGLAFSAYYRRRNSQRDRAADDGAVDAVQVRTDKLRLRFVYAANDNLEVKTDIDCCLAVRGGQGRSRGIALTQTAAWRIPRTPLRCAAVFSLFDTDDYDSRIYLPSRSLPPTFYYPAASGRGTYFSAIAQCAMGRWLRLGASWSVMARDDVETMGSGPELIDGNTRSEVAAIVTVRF